MAGRIRAVYEQGVFRPLELVEGLVDGTVVRLHVETEIREGGSLSDVAGI